MTVKPLSPADQADFIVRNAASALPAGQLAKQIAKATENEKPLRIKIGLDPTAPDIHLGHAVVLQKVREFQDLGHKVILIIGDMTARVGDPSGRDTTRPVLSEEDIIKNAKTFQAQAFKILDASKVEVVFNSEHLDMPMGDFFNLLRSTTVAQILEREDFSNRFKDNKPISVLELVYPLMQAFDSFAIEADVELGGTDQLFNLMLGRDVQRHFGIQEQSIVTMPILPGLDGVKKMSKSLGNHVGITDSPKDMFGKLLSIPDNVMNQFFDLLLGETMPDLGPRDAKHLLAHKIVTRFHSEEEADQAKADFESTFVDKKLPTDIPVITVEAGLVQLPELLETAFGVSRSEGRRLIKNNAVKVNGERWNEITIDSQEISGKTLQAGKLRFALIEVL